MGETLSFFKTITEAYWGNFAYGAMFFLSVGIIFAMETNRLKKMAMVWYPALIMVVVYNPLMVVVCRIFFYENAFVNYYLKLFNILPVVFVLAFGLTFLVNQTSGVKKLMLTLLILVVLVASGESLYRQVWYHKAANREKVSPETLELVDFFKDTDEQIRVLVPIDMSVYLREVDSKFALTYSREDDENMAAQLASEKPNTQDIYNYALGFNINYVVASDNEKNSSAFAKDNNFTEIGAITNYKIYSVYQPEWVVVEMEDISGNQGMCYLIKNTEDGSLIVIDGGSRVNAESLYYDIKRLGGHVDAWIITHYHKDHVGAFLEMFQNQKEYEPIVVDKVYDSLYDADYFRSRAYEWDDIEYFDQYLELTSGWDNLEHVKRGDEISLGSLDIKFFNSYDDAAVEHGYDDIGNNGALVFKLSVNDESILFMSDCHSQGMAEYFIETYKDELKADYLQVAHHGNNSVPDETGFYEVVDPKTAIFDAPEWLMDGEEYTAKDLRKYLQAKDIDILWLDRHRNAFGLGDIRTP